MHVGDLDAATKRINSLSWSATVTIKIHTASEGALSGATVYGRWRSGSSSLSVSCVTNSVGECSSAVQIRRNTSATFSVTNVTYTGFTYNAGANHDPDGDSNGTSIVMYRP